MKRVRVMFWVQHLMGIGHQRRAASIVRQLCLRGAEVCYASGGYPLPGLDLGAARLVQLPPARAADVSYETLLDEHGRPVSPQWKRARREALLYCFDRFNPEALVIETYPFGRGLLRFELEPLVDRAHRRNRRPRLYCSLRDIVHPRSRKRNESIAGIVRSRFDAVLVHSDPDVVELGASFPQAGEIGEWIRYTGYVAAKGTGPLATTPGAATGVVVSGGGGVVAERLLEAAVHAFPLSRWKHEPWLVLAGPAVSEGAFQRLRALAGGGVRVERNRTDFPRLLADCRVSVSQAGYNTLLDVVQARARAVIVPFEEGNQTEQSARARLFERKGLVHVLSAEELDAEALAAAVDRAAGLPRPPGGVLDLGGAERSAELVLGNRKEVA